MKKMLFNDKFSLTEAVLSGRKTWVRTLSQARTAQNQEA